MIEEIEHMNTADYGFCYEFEMDTLEEFQEALQKVKKRHSELKNCPRLNVKFDLFLTHIPKVSIKIVSLDE